MYLESENVKRCGIFLFFDKDGIVDEYIPLMLKDLRRNMKYLLVVCNGYVNAQGLEKLRSVTDEVLCRANVGFDVGGYREALFYLGWKQLEQYDEIVMLNYTIFAPLYPFKEMFDVMAKKDVSFWGITKHHKVEPDPFQTISYGYLPEHIQSHFLVLRKDLFMSYQYRDFICNMKNPQNYVESVCGYEAIFTKYFSDLGFSWDVYTDTSDYEGYAFNPLMFYPTEVVKEKRCPIIKRRSFFTTYSDFLLNTCGESSAELYRYLCEKTDYNMDLIWDNLLRLENHTAVHRCLHLNYVLESYDTLFQWKKKIALVIIVGSVKRCVWYRKYLKYFPEMADVYVYGQKEHCDIVREMCVNADKVHIHIMDRADYRDALLHAMEDLRCCSYDYVGIANMKDVETEEPFSNTVSWQYSDWESLFYNKNVIGNLADSFENNPRMGMCIPPIPKHGCLLGEMGNGWWGEYDNVKELLRDKNVLVNTNPSEYPLTPIGGSFWIRGILMQQLRSCFAGIEEKTGLAALPFFIQHEGYYTGIGYSDRSASVEVTNSDHMMRENNKTVFRKYGANVYPVVVERINTGNFAFGEDV